MSDESSRKHITGRIPNDDYQRFEKYREKQGINKTDAVRRLIRAGLDAELDSPDTNEVESAKPNWASELWPLQVWAIVAPVLALFGALIVFALWQYLQGNYIAGTAALAAYVVFTLLTMLVGPRLNVFRESS